MLVSIWVQLQHLLALLTVTINDALLSVCEFSRQPNTLHEWGCFIAWSIIADLYNSPSSWNCFTVCQYICWYNTPVGEAVLKWVSIFADPHNSPSWCCCFTVCQYIFWPCTNPSRWGHFRVCQYICWLIYHSQSITPFDSASDVLTYITIPTDAAVSQC
jgi:hypothetical protein